MIRLQALEIWKLDADANADVWRNRREGWNSYVDLPELVGKRGSRPLTEELRPNVDK